MRAADIVEIDADAIGKAFATAAFRSPQVL